MGGCSMADQCEFTSPLTLVLVGKTGNGKSATGNSILGAKKFVSKRRSSGVTITSKLHTTVLDDGRMLNVIDTPGLFDSSTDHEFIGKEIVRCIDMARNGIHAVLVVFSVCNRFSEEEKAAETLSLCGDRYLIFDNKTKDEFERSDQVHKLLSLVNKVLLNNSGNPYSNEMFNEFKKYDREGDQEDAWVRDEQFKRILEMVESRLKETNLKLEQLLAEERAARIEAEKKVEAVQKKSDEEILKMKEEIETMKKRENEEQQKREKRGREGEDGGATGRGRLCYLINALMRTLLAKFYNA